MTSKPASRRARATSFAPRSWPSSPGFATSTLAGVVIASGRFRYGVPASGHASAASPSEDRRLLVLAPHVLELLRDLADRAVLLDALDQLRHEVGVAPGRVAQLRQGGQRGAGVACPPHLGQAVEL